MENLSVYANVLNHELLSADEEQQPPAYCTSRGCSSTRASDLMQKETSAMNDIRDGHHTLGIAYLNAERYDEAIEQLEKTVSVDAGFIEAHHALALAYFGHHRIQDAKDAALEALKIDATYQPTLTFLQTIDPSVPSTPQVTAVPTVQPEVTATPVEKEGTPVPNVEQTTAERTPVKKENAPPKEDGTDIDKELERGAVFLSNK